MGGSSAESSAGVGGNQVYLDEKLAARGNRALRDGGGCGERRLKILQYQSPHTCVCFETDRKTVKKRAG